MSTRRSTHTPEHFAALFDPEGIVVAGASTHPGKFGFVTLHNLRAFGPQAHVPAKAFDDWLETTMLHTSPAERSQRLLDWETAPSARFAHPREEHLLPLMVALGAGGDDAAVRDHASQVLGWAVSGYRFG